MGNDDHMGANFRETNFRCKPASAGNDPILALSGGGEEFVREMREKW